LRPVRRVAELGSLSRRPSQEIEWRVSKRRIVRGIHLKRSWLKERGAVTM
jgi:hypothetical protein